MNSYKNDDNHWVGEVVWLASTFARIGVAGAIAVIGYFGLVEYTNMAQQWASFWCVVGIMLYVLVIGWRAHREYTTQPGDWDPYRN